MLVNFPLSIGLPSYQVPCHLASSSATGPLRVGIGCQKFFIVCATWFLLSNSLASGNAVVDYYTRQTQALAAESLQNWQRASAAAAREFDSRGPLWVNYGGGTKALTAARQQALRDYLSKLIPATEPSSDVAHIPDEYPVSVDISDAAKKWTIYYDKAKNRLRPDVEYEYKSNADEKKVGTITLSEAHIQNLKDNFDILMWYRNELGSRAAGDNHIGDQKFKLFLDYFVADLLKSLPSAARINIATGSVDPPEWELDERRLREQLIMVYRYLIAKFQIYPEYEEFGPADRELLISMMKIALLMGADMDPQWFQEKVVNLKAVNEKAKWKEPIAEALGVLKAKSEEEDMPVEEQLQSSMRHEEPCVIAIPPPKPKPATKPPSQPRLEDGQKIEIIVRPKP